VKTKNANLQNEQAQAEFIGVSTFAVSALVITLIVQALLAEPKFEKWQFFYVSGITAAFLLSMLLRKIFDIGAFLFPVFLYMITAPVFIGDLASEPWMSIGLVSVTANIYFGAFDSWIFGIASMIGITILQGWVIQQNPASVADLTDMKLLGGYFSLTWTLGIGLAAIIIRRNYIKVLDTVDSEIREETLRIIGRLQRISKINRNDFRNLKLHSTTLNTLIYYRNQGNLAKNSSAIFGDLNREINELKELQIPSDITLQELLNRVITNRIGKRIEISEMSIHGDFKNSQIRDNFVEIFRELLLNIEKHTSASEMKISIEIAKDDKFTFTVIENSPNSMNEPERAKLLNSASSSKSLQRLIEIFDGELNLRLVEGSTKLEHAISGGFKELEVDSNRSILGIRIRGIDDYALGFARTTYLFGLIYLPGYFFLDINNSALVLIAFHAILANIISFKYKSSNALLSLLSVLSIVMFPILSQEVSVCQDTNYFPWLYNIILANAFIVAFTVRNIFLRWLPLFFLTVESLLLPRTFPDGCQNIFVGSLPGIPIIATFAIALIIIKKRAASEDLKNIKKVYEDRNNVLSIDEQLETEYQKVLKSLEMFRDLNSSLKENDQELIEEIELEIQRIRAYLFASEQFESEFIRNVYGYLMTKYEKRKLVRLIINGKNFFQFDDEVDSSAEISKWDMVFREGITEINLISGDNLIVNFRIPGLSQEKVSEIMKVLNTNLSSISYSISTM
jgi:signal transduction histidine kinase